MEYKYKKVFRFIKNFNEKYSSLENKDTITFAGDVQRLKLDKYQKAIIYDFENKELIKKLYIKCLYVLDDKTFKKYAFYDTWGKIILDNAINLLEKKILIMEKIYQNIEI